MKVALVCDWLTNVGGAERVLLSIHEIFPDAPIYTSQYNKKGIDWFKDADVRTGWMQILPSGMRRFFAPLRVLYFKHLDLSEYDLIISVTGAEAKGIKKGNAKHLCYCHVPTQYYWQMYDEYLKNPGFGIFNPIARLGLKLLIKPLRKADFKAASKPDQFITISKYAADQIKRFYHRESVIIHPSVSVEKFQNIKKGKSQTKLQHETKESQDKVIHQLVEKYGNTKPYIATSRQVTWKRLDLAVKSCLKLKRPLVLIGDGPEHKNLQKLAQDSDLITFVPTSDQATIKTYLENSRGFLFPSLEPFGIAPVEALAAGCPVVAYTEGGSRDFIQDGKNGVFFDKQTVNSLTTAIEKFEKIKFDSEFIQQSALPFSDIRFKQELKDLIDEQG